MRDLFIEVWESIRRNKIRTCLTGFAVVWGIFMLMVLLGGGNGLMNAFIRDSSNVSTNVMRVYGSNTSKAYAGYKEGRNIKLDEKDIDITSDESFNDIITGVAPIISVNQNITNGKYYSGANIVGTTITARTVFNLEIQAGRFINQNDEKGRLKVIVLPSNVAKHLSRKESEYLNLIGKVVRVGKINFKVIGIYKADSVQQVADAYCPYSTIRTIWKSNKYIDRLAFTFHNLTTTEDNEAFEKEYKKALNANHYAAPDDNSSIWLSNSFTQQQQIDKATSMLTKGLWIVGILTLLSGIVGIGNIMLITVKERTHEFGIRKALGAKPWSITKLIITESILVTGFFGYIGMVLGMLACEVIDKLYGQNPVSILGQTIQVFKDPGVDIKVAIEATILLVIAGTIAGLIPAIKAAKVKPIEALRAD